jgi:hypothetical protein
MEKLVNRLATELAKYEFNELENLLSDMPFIKAYNVLKGFNLEMDEWECKGELLSISVRFDFNYKHINGTIFQTEDGGCELYEIISVWDDEFSSPIIERLEMEC